MYILQSVIMVWDFKWQYWQLLGNFVCCKIFEWISLWYQSIESSQCSKEMVSFNRLHFFGISHFLRSFITSVWPSNMQRCKYVQMELSNLFASILTANCSWERNKFFEMKTERMEKCWKPTKKMNQSQKITNKRENVTNIMLNENSKLESNDIIQAYQPIA